MIAPGLGRRRFLGIVAGLGVGAIAGCSNDSGTSRPASAASPPATASPTPARPPLVPGTANGAVSAAPMEVDLAGEVVTTWGYNGVVPGPEIRVRRGERVQALLTNDLTEETTIHWHGVSIANAMDGVPGLTQEAVLPGAEFSYDFEVPDAGSHMYHSHVGHQLDRGLYGPLIVDSDDDEPLAYDSEYTLMLDDWEDGLTPAEPQLGGGPSSFRFGQRRATASPSSASGSGSAAVDSAGDDPEPDALPEEGSNPGDRLGGRVYPHYLINARPAADPMSITVRQGERIRLRLMNIAADTGFVVAIAGHTLTITHTDGMAIEPIAVDAVRLGMGERYDVVVTANNPGAWQIAAMPEAKRGLARAVLRYSEASATAAPTADELPQELFGRRADYGEMRYAGPRDRPRGEPDRVLDLTLASNSRINDQRYPDADPLFVEPGELVRVKITNTAALAHPMHLHGHAFWVDTPSGDGPLKDTMIVLPDGGVGTFDFVADNPGPWLFHCHNNFHMENGMARVIRYR